MTTYKDLTNQLDSMSIKSNQYLDRYNKLMTEKSPEWIESNKENLDTLLELIKQSVECIDTASVSIFGTSENKQ